MSGPDEVIKIRKCRGYTQIDNAVLRSGVSCRAIGLLLLMWSKPPGWRFSSVRIADEVAEGREAIRTAMRELIDAGFVRCVRVGAPPHTVYWLRDDTHQPWPDDPSPQVKPEDGFLGAHDPVAQEPVSKVNTERSTPEVVIKTSARPSGERGYSEEPLFEDDTIQTPGFDEFYASYPRKQKRRDAAKAWTSATHRAKPDVIMAALQARKAWWVKARTPKDKIPYPASWLNADSWLDELEPTPVAAATGMVQKAADLADRQRDEVDRAVAAGDPALAWQLTRARARASGEGWFDDIARYLDEGRNDLVITAAAKRDGRRVTVADIDEVRAVKHSIYQSCGQALSLAIGQSST